MTFPAGVTLCEVTIPASSVWQGGASSITATLTPTRTVYHRATGAQLTPITGSATGPTGAGLKLTVPHGDQPGYRNAAGNSITGWEYDVIGSYKDAAGVTQTLRKQVRILRGMTSLDLLTAIDYEPRNEFDGKLGGALPARLEEAALSATYVAAGEEWINVKKHAAINGLDFTTALEQALASSMNVHIPYQVGGYNISRQITLTSNKRIEGLGGKNAAKLVVSSGWDVASSPAVIKVTGTNASIERIVIDATAVPGVDPILIDAVYEPSVEHVQVLGGRHGLNILNGLESRFEHLSIKNCAGSGVYIQDVPDVFMLNVNTDNCDFGLRSIGGSITAIHFHAIKSKQHGFYMVGPSSSQFFAPHADTNGKNGFHITDAFDLTMTAPWGFRNGAVDNTAYNFLFSNCTRTSISGAISNNEDTVSASYAFFGTNDISFATSSALTKGVTGSTAGIRFAGCMGVLAKLETAANVQQSLAVRGAQPIAPQEKVISSFDAGHGWTVNAGFASTNLNDPTAAILGTQGITGTTAGTGAGNTFDSPVVPAFNPAGKQYVADIMVSDPTKLRSIQLFVGDSPMTNSTGMYGIHTTINPRGKLLANVPYRVIFGAGATPQVVGTGAGTAAVRYRFRVADESSGPVTVKIGGLTEYTPPAAFPNGVVSIGFDDSWSPEHYLPMMQRRRFRGTIYPILDQLDVAGKLSTATVLDLAKRFGWDVGAHASSLTAHSTYATMTADQVEVEVRTVKKWLVERGLTGQSYASPGGAWSTTIEGITERYFRTNRTSGSGREYLPPPRPQSMRSITVLNTHTLAELTARVDEAYANQQLLDLCFHIIAPTNPTADAYTWLSADFDSLLSYIATKGIPVLPIGHVLNRLSSGS